MKSARKLSLTRETLVELQEVGGGEGYPMWTLVFSFCKCPTLETACTICCPG